MLGAVALAGRGPAVFSRLPSDLGLQQGHCLEHLLPLLTHACASHTWKGTSLPCAEWQGWVLTVAL